MTVLELCETARAAAARMAAASSEAKSGLLNCLADLLLFRSADILAANCRDVDDAEMNGITEVMVDRLLLTEGRIASMADAVRAVAALDDPIGIIEGGVTRPNGLRIINKRVPLGVVAIIYESRPNVTVDIAALCLKAGNSVVLRGGKEAINSNMMLVQLIKEALSACGFSEDTVGLVTDTSRESARQLMEMTGYVDLLIPRGGKALIDSTFRNAKVPVIETGAGNCHVYIDEHADIEMGLRIAENAKVQRPSVCNAAETLLVHSAVAEVFLPKLFERIGDRVEFRADERAKAAIPDASEATEDDWHTEFLDYILAVRVVDSVEEAVRHIAKYGTRHSEAIVTQDIKNADYFLENIDAAAVYLNASTRFTDGEEFGLSAEVGISTSKLHARGPMGLKALTTTKTVVIGSGQIRG